MKGKLTEDQLMRLAFICAEQDRSALAECWDKGTPEHKQAMDEYRQLVAYRLKRWGRSGFETMLEGMKSVSLQGIMKGKNPNP